MADDLSSTVRPRNSEQELAQKNLAWGWALFGLAIALFAGTIGVAYVYLWLS